MQTEPNQKPRKGDDPPLEAEDLPDYDWSKPIEPQRQAAMKKKLDESKQADDKSEGKA